MRLRYYQEQAVAAVWDHVSKQDDNPCVVIPTGGGKTPVIATLCKDVVGWKGRVACVTHVKELIQQNFNTLSAIMPEVPIGVYSAGLKSRDTGYSVTCAGIQSVYDKAEAFGKLDVIVVDEAHRIPDDGEGMYRSFLQAAKEINPRVVLIGLTATPYRMGSGMLCKPGNLLNRVVYEIGVRELIVKGFLSPLKSKATTNRTDVSNVSIRGGEYVQSELQAAVMKDEDHVVQACLEIAEKTQNRKSVLVFCTGIDHARKVAGILSDTVESGSDGFTPASVRTIFGDTPDEERAAAIVDFKSGKIKYLVNVDVLTTGFDAPAVDCVAILRPTLSPGLFYQMVGRGFRLADGKKDCLVLDFGNNLFTHGPVDRMVISEDKKTGQVGNGGARFKECPHCLEVVLLSCGVCLDCGHVFEKATRETSHSGSSDDREALSGPEPVAEIDYQKHEKVKNPENKPPTLRVNYYCGLMHTPAEYIGFQSTSSFARQKATEWWRARSSEPVPKTVDEALDVIHRTGIREPKKIILQSQNGFLKPVQYLEMGHNPKPYVVGDQFKKQPVDDKAFANQDEVSF